MPVQLICRNLRCRKILAVPDEVRGKLVKCQHCQTMFRVPETRPQPAPAGAAAAAAGAPGASQPATPSAPPTLAIDVPLRIPGLR